MASENHKLSQRRQSALLRLIRSSHYYRPVGGSAESLKVMEIIDRRFLETPWSGPARWRASCGAKVTNVDATGPLSDEKDATGPNLSGAEYVAETPPAQGLALPSERLANHAAQPDLAAYITYIPMRRGFLNLVAVMDWCSRKAPAWRLSNSMETDFCVEALKEAMADHGPPAIVNSPSWALRCKPCRAVDLGSRFPGHDWTNAGSEATVKISMNARERWIYNRMIEHLGRSVKFESVYLNAFETGTVARTGIGRWLDCYNAERPHSIYSTLIPNAAYETRRVGRKIAARNQNRSPLIRAASGRKTGTTSAFAVPVSGPSG